MVTLLLIAGAWSLGPTGAKSETGGHAEATAEAPSPTNRDVERPEGDFQIATVNGEPIYHADFVLAVQSLPPSAQPIAAKPAGKRVILEEMIKVKILEQEAKRLGLDREPEVAVQLNSALDNLLAGVALERLVSSAPKDLREFYDAYTNQFRGTSVRQVLIAYDGGLIPKRGGGTSPSEAEAMKKAIQIAKRLRGGEDFASVAAAESDDDQTAKNGGSLGVVRPGQLGSLLDGAVDALAINEISDPIRSAYGIHIFEVTGREISPFEQMEVSLRRQGDPLRARIVVNDLKEKASVEITNPQFFEETVP